MEKELRSRSFAPYDAVQCTLLIVSEKKSHATPTTDQISRWLVGGDKVEIVKSALVRVLLCL